MMPRLPQFYGDGARVLREQPWLNGAQYRAALIERCEFINSEIVALLRDDPSADDDGYLTSMKKSNDSVIAQLKSQS
jgi:hypothetical protein